MKAIIGGPSYNLTVDTRHAGAMVELALELNNRCDLESLTIQYQHAVPVEMARNAMFRQALDSDATHLVWADSDVYWGSHGNREIAWVLQALESQKLPFATIPVAQRDGVANIWSSHLVRVSGGLKVERRLIPCHATGLGFGAFYLPWYRHNWSTGPHFRTEWQGKTFMSEDYWHTSYLRTLRSAPRYAPVCEMFHASRTNIIDTGKRQALP